MITNSALRPASRSDRIRWITRKGDPPGPAMKAGLLHHENPQKPHSSARLPNRGGHRHRRSRLLRRAPHRRGCRVNQPTTYWISSDYLTLRRGNHQLAIRLDGRDASEAIRSTISEMDATIHRLQRRRALLGVFLNGDAVSDPSALRL